MCAIIYTNAHISIDIDAAELQSIGELLVETYLHQNLIQRAYSLPNTILQKIKSVATTVLQLIGVTISLIAANVLSPILQTKIEPTTLTTTTTAVNSYQYDNITLNPFKLCPHDFGCDRSVCWRSCNSTAKGTIGKSWCYTSANPRSNKPEKCLHIYNCSPCWECLSVCHTPRS